MKYLFLPGFLMICQLANCQKMVSITIDDVPNTRRFEKDGFQSVLMQKLDSLEIPIAIFINEARVYSTDSITRNFGLLNDWAQKEYTTLGNHSFSHARYSITGVDAYASEIINGEAITRQLAKKYNKSLQYFRFPFNDLGEDTVQHVQVRNFLKDNGYTITPYTVESVDWMFNFVYEDFLDKGEVEKAKETGEEYLRTTLAYFEFFEDLAFKDYQRTVNQIYLCHDTKLNADYFPQLINELKKRGYEFISLGEALTDKVYQQKENYYKKWGASWLYRWQATHEVQGGNMRKEPSTESITTLYNEILERKDK